MSSPRSGGYGSSSPLNQSIGRYGSGAVSATAAAAAVASVAASSAAGAGAGAGLNASIQQSTRSSVTGITPLSPLDQSLKRQAAAGGGGGSPALLNQSLSRRFAEGGPPSPGGGGAAGGSLNQSFGRLQAPARPPGPAVGAGGPALGVQVSRNPMQSCQSMVIEILLLGFCLSHRHHPSTPQWQVPLIQSSSVTAVGDSSVAPMNMSIRSAGGLTGGVKQ